MTVTLALSSTQAATPAPIDYQKHPAFVTNQGEFVFMVRGKSLDEENALAFTEMGPSYPALQAHRQSCLNKQAGIIDAWLKDSRKNDSPDSIALDKTLKGKLLQASETFA